MAMEYFPFCFPFLFQVVHGGVGIGPLEGYFLAMGEGPKFRSDHRYVQVNLFLVLTCSSAFVTISDEKI